MSPSATPEPVTVLHVRVQPRASRESIRVEPDGKLRISLLAPPVENAANEALCRLLAEELRIAKSAVRVVAGQKSREKTVRIEAPAARIQQYLDSLRTQI